VTVRRPAPDPCESCPYRVDVQPGIWALDQYLLLMQYDRPTGEQPAALFLCHQNASGSEQARVCAGWAGTHRCNPRGHELLALRMAEHMGNLLPQDLYATHVYRPRRAKLFPSGAAAAAHGISGIPDPSPQAVAAINKIVARRPDITPPADHGRDDREGKGVEG
jgi:hypothetical protein